MRKLQILLIFLLMISITLLTACEKDSKSKIANPASTFCVDKGGTLEIRTANDGSQTGYCILNGKQCEEWAFYRGECSLTDKNPGSDSLTFCTAQQRGQPCTRDYNPVCGSNGKTYGNACTACAESEVRSWASGECPNTFINYDITIVLNETCAVDRDCSTPMGYLVRSNCPYTSKCLKGLCTVVCPMFDNVTSKYYDVKDCGECPQYVSPSPDWCKDGTIVSGPRNECGCQSPPTCIGGSIVRHTCSQAEKSAEICTMEYAPVCGADGKTYGNGCQACAAKIDYWIKGECT